jgi:hypothetical protein
MFLYQGERASSLYRGKPTTSAMTVMATSVAPNQSHCEGSASGSGLSNFSSCLTMETYSWCASMAAALHDFDERNELSTMK